MFQLNPSGFKQPHWSRTEVRKDGKVLRTLGRPPGKKVNKMFKSFVGWNLPVHQVQSSAFKFWINCQLSSSSFFTPKKNGADQARKKKNIIKRATVDRTNTSFASKRWSWFIGSSTVVARRQVGLLRRAWTSLERTSFRHLPGTLPLVTEKLAKMTSVGFSPNSVSHWGVFTVRVKPLRSRCKFSVCSLFTAQGHKKRDSGGQNLRFACAKRRAEKIFCVSL